MGTLPTCSQLEFTNIYIYMLLLTKAVFYVESTVGYNKEQIYVQMYSQIYDYFINEATDAKLGGWSWDDGGCQCAV